MPGKILRISREETLTRRFARLEKERETSE
jgi:hypothetical protein